MADKNDVLRSGISKTTSEEMVTETTTVSTDLPDTKLKWLEPPDFCSPELKEVWNFTMPLDLPTIGLKSQRLYAGYRNQAMSLSSFAMMASREGYSQILMETVQHQDTYGSNRMMPFEYLFDVPQWNSQYPKLPRMVHCDPNIHTNYDCEKKQYNWHSGPNYNYANPVAFGDFRNILFSQYVRYGKRKGPHVSQGFPNPVDVLIKRGALRPHPELIQIRNNLLGTGSNRTTPYMTLHARVEPDMQQHPVCKDRKVTNLTEIFQSLEAMFPDPPTPLVFVPINRQMMEKGARGIPGAVMNGNDTNWLAVENLNALNRAVAEGLWNGRAKVVEFGSNALQATKFATRWSTTGAALNFEIALGAAVFVGTPVSSYSVDIMHHRFIRGDLENYQYLPNGLHRWTDENTDFPPGFGC